MAEASPLAKGAHPFSAYEFTLARRYLGARRKDGGIALIAIISFLGITLGVAVLIVVMSVMNGFRQELLSQMLGVQSHIYIDLPTMEPSEIEALQEEINAIPGVSMSGQRTTGLALMTVGNAALPVQVVGIDPQELRQIPRISGVPDGEGGTGLQYGSIDGFGAGRNGGDQILLGAALANSVGAFPGDEITLVGTGSTVTPMGTIPRRKAYEVGGVYAVGIYDYERLFVFMPLDQAILFFALEGPQTLEIRVEDPLDFADQLNAIQRLAAGRFRVRDWQDQSRSFYTALQVERVVMRLIMGLIILIAALNIITGLVMLVKNKSRDVAILRTIGMTSAAIMRTFTIIGLMIGGIGSIGGALLGVVIVENLGAIQAFVEWIFDTTIFPPEVYFLTSLPALLDWSEVFYSSALGLTASFLAAILPAWRAARLDPVEALRYE